MKKNKLYAYLGEDLVEALKRNEAIIAGGTITSLFNNKEINDVDIYFRSDKKACSFIEDCWNNNVYVTSHTKKATLFIKNKLKLQMIHFKFFSDAESIFNTFDFIVCMGAFDFKTEAFTLHEDFLKHNSQRILKFNSQTAFPIVSLLRVQKYTDKEYTISKPEFIRIVLTCMDLTINTYEELKDQMGGMYGINYDKLFEDEKEEDFNLREAVDKIADMVLDEDYFKEPVNLEFNDLDDLLNDINKSPVKTLKINDIKYRIGIDGLLKESASSPCTEIELDTKDFFDKTYFYKFVRKQDGKLTSFYDKNFEYVIGEEVKAKGTLDSWSNRGRLYFNEKAAIEQSTYYGKEDGVLIEVNM
ncbi:hypothetical protein [Bacillus atrophaeus]|uniref:Nucleotidyltransferase n=1 Tax=Bacillus atrophaeus (strain 1942) TaxID=720555 RepID=A0ABN3ZAN6_BACA1|nr:hypothetical protein [Bacillus atrophaeus]AMR62687.1 hypothetical protein A1D11_09840 [Bacillus subtilis subsp. globigii]ADP32452.1 hypothetical protein BATR1942_07565 [Bacillus atrophaeus 1942]AIK49271.1 hypothetical protein DJ95_1412 [Bacillus atrophaeus subsp. globigii]EIM11748.1 hypothetical protein UY9_05797 [Bacillus atrophaeus C89]KFK82408.1 hypothetical protein DK44_2224 [Bacillus atrophaeus]